ncbi:MAG TPA: aconitase family protein, partial [Verrucomicrobiae bacterium]|nr:aconitase family protein [Verrucomicrobiae bacterium]
PEGLHPVLTSGKLELKVPEVITFDLVGDLKADTMPRDIALYLLGNFHAQIKGKAVALQGEFLTNLSPAGKMTICNILPEGGAVTAFFVPAGDEDESIDHIIDVDGIEPMVAIPPEPTSVKPVRELAGTPITVAIVGGCSAGRIEDMEAVAEILATADVHRDVTLLITPASQKVAGEMDARGFSSLFREKGALVLPPGCGPCPGKHLGVLAPGDVAIATIVRNTPGRMGSPEAQIYLGSPYTVARAAVHGKL